jgi:glutamyl-tRNA synthetase
MIKIQAPVRVRFAPSPTGYLHIGGVRTALFNWLFARHYGGQFLLRIEDTDEKRFVEGAANDIMESLRWVGIDWDEGPDRVGPHTPYVQSLRKEQGIYQPHIEYLLEHGHAYMSFTTEEELAQMRAEAEAKGIKSFRFRGPERDWPLAKQRELAAAGKPYTVRLKTPLTGSTVFRDLVRGGDGITVQHNELQDIVLIKTSGMPVYHFAHLVDDHLMGVTHVLRAEEWVPSAPYHLLLYGCFGWQAPEFAHLPVILRQDGKGKLSKRKDDAATNRFWERGYLPEAMFNYLALQGWSYDDHTEIMSREEIVERFTIDRVLPSPARWNPDKLKDMNGIYIRKHSRHEVATLIAPFLAQANQISNPPSTDEVAYVEQLVPLVHERLEELSQAPDFLGFFFNELDAIEPSALIQKKMDVDSTRTALEEAHKALSSVEQWSEPHLEESLRALAEQLELKPGQLFGTLRVATTGRTVAPPLFETLVALGRDRTLARIAAALTVLT